LLTAGVPPSDSSRIDKKVIIMSKVIYIIENFLR